MAGRRNGNSSHAARIEALERDITEFHDDVRDIRTSMVTRRDLEGLIAQIRAIATKQEEGSRPQWQMWAVVATCVFAIYYLVYTPIKETMTRMDTSIIALQDRSVPQRAYDADQKMRSATLERLHNDIGNAIMRQRYDQDQEHLQKDIAELTKRQVTREEHQEKWKSFEVQHADLKTLIGQEVGSLQRQITQNTERLNNVWNARDALIDMRERLDRLESTKNSKLER